MPTSKGVGVEPVFVGVDVGSATVKVAGVDRLGRVGVPSYLRLSAFPDPGEAVKAAYASYLSSLPPTHIVVAAGTTGSGRELQAHLVGAAFSRTEIVAHAAGLLDALARGEVSLPAPHPGSIVELGGQDSKLILFSDGVPTYFNMNSICSAGTGEFLQQIADEAGIPLEEFGKIALASTNPAPIDPTCTVFARRDFRHLTQKGVPLADRLMGIARAMVRNYLTNLAGSQPLPRPVVFQGGVASNVAVVKAFAEALGEEPIIPPGHGLMGALGMAVLVRAASEAGDLPPAVRELEALEARAFTTSLLHCHGCRNACEVTAARTRTGQLIDLLGGRCERGQDPKNLRPEPQSREVVRVRPPERPPVPPFPILARKPRRDSTGLYFAGLDVGSRGTKFAVIVSEGPSPAPREGYRVVGVGSLDTAGDALDAVLRAARAMEETLPPGARLAALGCTGSGGELAHHVLVGREGEYADCRTTEIIAHYIWASEVLPEVQTVIDIGGNDAKLIAVTPTGLEFGMNDKCAAGTGSFLEAVARRLHVPLEEYGTIARESLRPARIAGRCAVFGESDLVHKARIGVPTPDLLAGVAEAIVKTYLSDVAKVRPIVPPVVAQGGAFLNTALVRAFRSVLGLSREEFFVHPDPGCVVGAGALGAAILAKDRWEAGLPTAFEGFERAFGRRWRTVSLDCRFPPCPKVCPAVVALLADGEPVAGYRGLSCEFGLFSGLLQGRAKEMTREVLEMSLTASRKERKEGVVV